MARPDRNDEYLLYQTLVGGLAAPTGSLEAAGYQELVDRLAGYMVKAVREAKVHTSWMNPDEEYEEAVRASSTGVLDRREGGAVPGRPRGLPRGDRPPGSATRSPRPC